MTRRFLKQLIYASAFLVVIALLVGGYYLNYVKPAPTCFDGIQNQGEQGIDCGGPCAVSCSLRSVKPLAVADRVLVLRPDAAHMSFLTQVSNPNHDYAARNFSYSFELLDARGAVIQSYPGESFIYAGEVKYILAANVPAPQTNYSSVDIKLDSNPDWVPAGQFPGPPQLNTAGAQTNISSDKMSVDGNVTNLEAAPLKSVTIVAIFRGKLGQVAGASQTEVENLAPSAPQPFSIIHPFVPDVDPLGTKIYAYAARQ
jgi:hypothetical protein